MNLKFWEWGKKKEKEEEEVPEEWVKKRKAKTKRKARKKKNNPKTRHIKRNVKIDVKRPFKIRIPYLLTIKRIVAGFLLLANFFIAQAALTSATASQPLYILFFLNALIILDYLWKTRRKSIEKEKEKEEWQAW